MCAGALGKATIKTGAGSCRLRVRGGAGNHLTGMIGHVWSAPCARGRWVERPHGPRQ